MKRDLQVGIAQWLAVPGEPKRNLQVALDMVDLATARGVELLVLPELWACGYDPVSLADDAKAAAEPRDGPRGERLAAAARAANLWLVAGSMPELDEKGDLYNTALVFNPGGDLVAWHRKAHLYPPTLEPSVFRAGDRLTTFEDPALGAVGVVIGFDGDFPEVAGTLARRGRDWLSLRRPTRSKGRRPGTSSTLRWRWPTASGGSSRTSAVRTG